MNHKIIPRPTEVIAREDVCAYLEDIYRAITQDTPEAWRMAADAARKIENTCVITRDALILKRQNLTPLPYPVPMDSTGHASDFACDELGIPRVHLNGRAS